MISALSEPSKISNFAKPSELESIVSRPVYDPLQWDNRPTSMVVCRERENGTFSLFNFSSIHPSSLSLSLSLSPSAI